MMTSLLFGQVSDGLSLEENVGRRTQVPVFPDAPPAEMPTPPDFNQVETDPNPNLGFVNRQLAGDWHEGEQYVPFWLGTEADQNESNQRVNKQVSTSGVAPAKEASGEWGHGTMKHSIAIEPTGDLREGGKMGNDYFVAQDPVVQSVMTDAMQPPPNADSDTRGAAMGQGKDAALAAKMNLQAWFSQTQG
jgi:hypothetical protein